MGMYMQGAPTAATGKEKVYMHVRLKALRLIHATSQRSVGLGFKVHGCGPGDVHLTMWSIGFAIAASIPS
jgi:hypothetical protein